MSVEAVDAATPLATAHAQTQFPGQLLVELGIEERVPALVLEAQFVALVAAVAHVAIEGKTGILADSPLHESAKPQVAALECVGIG